MHERILKNGLQIFYIQKNLDCVGIYLLALWLVLWEDYGLLSKFVKVDCSQCSMQLAHKTLWGLTNSL